MPTFKPAKRELEQFKVAPRERYSFWSAALDIFLLAALYICVFLSR